jgi:hypothetical protein
LLDLVELAHQLRENDSALEPRIQEEASEEERVVEATHVSQNSHDGVDISRVHVDLLVELEHLKEVEALAWACVWISNQISLRAELIEVVLIVSVEEAKEIVIQLERVLLIENDRLQAPTRQQRIVDIFHEVLDGLLEIVNVELSADHDLNHCDLLNPLVKLLVIGALRVRTLAPLEYQLYSSVLGGVKVALQSEICGVWAVVSFDAELGYLFSILVEDVLANLALGEGNGLVDYLPVPSSIGRVLLDDEALLSED